MRALLLIALVGCEHGQTPPGSDGPSPTDGTMTDCNPELVIEGELIDWDSSDANFQGVFGATLTQNIDASVTVTTAPNGRLLICAARSDPFQFTFDTSSDGHLPGTLTIEPNALLGFTPLSVRTLTQARANSFFGEVGLTFGSELAQIVVLQTGDRASLTLSGTHDTPRQGDEDGTGVITWTAGSSGRYVLFPNVAPSSSVQLAGDPLGPRPIPAIAGQISLVAISFVLE